MTEPINPFKFINTEIRDELLPDMRKFLKIANQQKKNNIKFCDLEKHKHWAKIFPQPELNTTNANVIDLTSDEENANDQEMNDLTCVVTETSTFQNNTQMVENQDNAVSTINDIACAIKENLETQHELSDNVVMQLKKCSENQDDLFKTLESMLNVKEIINLGKHLHNLPYNSILVICFCRYLLIPMTTQEFFEDLCTFLNQFCMKNSNIMKREFTVTFASVDEAQSSALLQYINRLDGVFKSELLSEIIQSVEKLPQNCFQIIECLVNTDTEPDTIKKLIQSLSAVADENSIDKNFGKLVMKVIKSLGQDVGLHEQSLSYIVNRHRSVWKNMLQKTFQDCFENSIMLSQSFR